MEEFKTEKKVMKAAISLAVNVFKAGAVAVISGALLLKSRKYITDAQSDATQINNIIKTALEDAKEEKANKIED